MSADNGIYILRTVRTFRETEPGCWMNEFGKVHYVWRVAEASAIDNFDYYKNNQLYNLGAYMHDVWGNSKVFLSEVDALNYALEISKNYRVLEYGISNIDTDYIFWGDM